MRYTVTAINKAPKDRFVVRISADCWLVGDFSDTKHVLKDLFPGKSVWECVSTGWVTV